LSDLSGQKRLEVDASGDLGPRHSVGEVLEHYLEKTGIPDHGLRWNAFSRGVRLDNKQVLEDVPAADCEWTVMPEVSAG
jgi:hypothetical protein